MASEEHPNPRHAETTDTDTEASTPAALQAALTHSLAEIAHRHTFSSGAVASMWASIRRGRGDLAQFDHAQFGGSGQWLRGGMIVVGDMFNHALQLRVGALCDDLSQLFDRHPEWRPEPRRLLSVHWWPAGLEAPACCGAQNSIRYAWFPQQRRLAVERDGDVRLYDTAEHHLGGVVPSTGDSAALRFSSGQGPVELASLQEVPTDRSDR